MVIVEFICHKCIIRTCQGQISCNLMIIHRKMRFLPHLAPHLEPNGVFWAKYKFSAVHASHTHSASYLTPNLTLSTNDKSHRAPFSPSTFSLFPWVSPQILARKFRKFMAWICEDSTGIVLLVVIASVVKFCICNRFVLASEFKLISNCI